MEWLSYNDECLQCHRPVKEHIMRINGMTHYIHHKEYNNNDKCCVCLYLGEDDCKPYPYYPPLIT